MMVRCIDNFLQSDVLIEGHRYEVLGERDDCYVLSGFDKPLSKVRFEPATPPIESPSEVKGKCCALQALPSACCRMRKCKPTEVAFGLPAGSGAVARNRSGVVIAPTCRPDAQSLAKVL